ncbi:hypothetical protein C8J56DRAFT_1044431 [Mycena floridula]|nr:hypothetical protein C8J56DRAFT_1044431 [Mycena floridula]
MAGPDRTSKTPPSSERPGPPIPRPQNAWILFRSEMSKGLPTLPGQPRLAQSEVSKRISKMWQEASPAVRAEYEAKADKAKAEHQLRFPQYRFNPIKKEEKSRIRAEKKREKEALSKKSRVAPVGTSPYPYPYPYAAYPVPAYYPTESPYGGFGPSPPMSAASSPGDTTGADWAESSEATSSASEPVPAPARLSSGPPFPTPPDPPLTLPQQDQSGWVAPNPDSAPSSQWPEYNSLQSQAYPEQQNDMVSFDVDQLQTSSWMPASFDDQFSALLSGTTDPSVFNLTMDPSLLLSNPAGEIHVSMSDFGQTPGYGQLLQNDGQDIPDFEGFQFGELWGGGQGQQVDASTSNDFSSFFQNPTQPPFNGEEYLNNNYDPNSYDPIEPSSSSSFTSANSSVSSQQQQQQQPIASSSSSRPYVPPSGASKGPIRRAGSYWPPSYATSDSMDISPPRYGVQAN